MAEPTRPVAMIAFVPVVDLTEAVEVWDLAGAVEALKAGNLFPSKVAFNALSGNPDVVQILNGLAQLGYPAVKTEAVSVPKLGGGTRPASDLAVEDQAVYAALTNAVRSRVHAGMVSFTRDEISYEQFEQFPVEFASEHDPVPEYVVMADAVSFYEYVDHDRLEAEVVGLTGLAGVAESLTDLLEAWMGVGRGIPQGPGASEALGDIYIAPASRTLNRAGFSHSRYSDDFRIPVASWSDALAAQAVLETSLRELGLVLSVPKLRTPTIERYLTYLNLIPELEEPGADELGWLIFDYEGEEMEVEPPSEEELAAAEQTFAEAIAVAGPDLNDSRRMKRALPWLGAGGSATPLTSTSEVLQRYAHATPDFAGYVARLMQTDLEAEAVAGVLAWLTSPGFKYPWQLGWLLHAVNGAEAAHPDLVSTSQAVLFDDSMPWFARGQAAIVSAAQGHLPPQRRFIDVYERSPRSVRPDLLAAVVIQQPTWGPDFMSAAAITPVLTDVRHFNPDTYRNWV